jgi:CelD/BcsL family acetyltransferase involved in cellulose biosynthesis
MSGTFPRTEIVSSLEAVRGDWVELAHESRNIFSTWEWASTWWRHYGRGHTPLVVVCRGRGGVTALLPLYVWSRRPLRVARFIGHGPADQLGPVCAATERETAAATLRHAATQARLDLVLAELLPGAEGWRDLLREKPLLAEASPILLLDGGWDGYLDRRSSNFRQQVRRRERNLGRQHAVRFRLAVEPDRLQDDMTLLFALHGARWGASDSAFARWEPFHRDFAALALERRWLRLWFLELDDRPVAAWYGFRFAGVESYYQAGRDPAVSEEAVGLVLLAHSIREAAADGMREYRLLRGAESFKLRFAEADPGVETFALARGAAGRASRVAVGVALRSATVRTALRRLGRASES